MRRLAGVLLLGLSGCSTSPLADFFDLAFPPRKIPPGAKFHGGVDGPQPAPPPPTVRPGPPVPLVPPVPDELPGLPVPSR